MARFAALHGGHAWVDERWGGGAAFHVLLPDVVSYDRGYAQVLDRLQPSGCVGRALARYRGSHGQRRRAVRPDSVSWRVQREATVMLGGARALLMHSAHPLVVAGARQTGMYANQPWRRLERTLRQTYTVVFGTGRRRWPPPGGSTTSTGASRGSTRSPGLRYDARDPDLLLWVHACLVDSFLTFERLTVGRLDDAGRQAFHEESMVSSRAAAAAPSGSRRPCRPWRPTWTR